MTLAEARIKYGDEALHQAAMEFRDLPDGSHKLRRATQLFGRDASIVIEALRELETRSKAHT